VPLPFELLYVHDPPSGERTPDLSHPFCHQNDQTIGRDTKPQVKHRSGGRLQRDGANPGCKLFPESEKNRYPEMFVTPIGPQLRPQLGRGESQDGSGYNLFPESEKDV